MPGGAQTAAAQASAGAAPAVATGPAAATPAAARAAGGGATGVDDPPATPAESPNGTDEQAAISQDTVIHPVPPGDGPRAPLEPGPADDHEDDDGPAADSGEPAAADIGPDDAGADPASAGEPEPDDDAPDPGADADSDDEHEQSATDEQIDGDEDGEGREQPAAAAIEPAGAADLPAPEEFHESFEVDEPAEAPPPAAATPPVPPRRPPVKIGSGQRPTVPDRGPREPLLPPYEQSRPGGALSKGAPASDGFFSSRRRALLVMGGTVLGIAVLAFGVQQLTGEDDGGGGTEPASNSGQAEEADTPQRSERPAAIVPGEVTVAVLNGTTVPGLARQIGDTVERQGFQLGTITNFIDQQRAESVVLYAPGAEREAADVGRRLKISQREPIDADSQGQAGDATVVVVAGADKTR